MYRHVYLFEKGIIICKKMEDGAMSCRTVIMVSSSDTREKERAIQ